MKVTIKTAHGYLSAQPPTPGGLARWQYRDTAGEWEMFDVDGLEFQPVPQSPDQEPVPVPVPDTGWALPANAADLVKTDAGRRTFITKARLIAYHEATAETVDYWLGKADEMIDRGVELGEGLNYFWTRLLGRGAGGPDVAIDGPYKGKDQYEGPLV